jgi:hypothetical protein
VERGASVDTEQSGDVLEKDKPRSNCADNLRDIGPEPPLIVGPSPSAGGAGGLAWETGSDEIHSSAPRCAVEGDEIVPDRSPIQGLIVHPRHESGRCVAFPLNVSHGANVDDPSETEIERSGSRAEAKGT